MGAAVLAKKEGYDVFVSDAGTISEKYRTLLTQHDIPFEDGGHTESLVLNADEIVKATLADPCCESNPMSVEDFLVRRILEEVTGRV